LETQFDESFGTLAALLARHRQRIVARWPDLAARRRGFERLLSGPLQGLLRRRRHIEAERLLDALLKPAAGAGGGAGPDTVPRGQVALVGAGPGDAGLLTLRGLRLINEADVILYDRLVSAEMLDLARRDAERIEVGKRAGHQTVPQDGINALLVAHASAGRRVVRLKGGDPFVFGRGGEQLEELRAAWIAYESVLGILAAAACAAYSGIPPTHRDLAQAVRLITAHARVVTDTFVWAALAQERQTLAFYMGVSRLD